MADKPKVFHDAMRSRLPPVTHYFSGMADLIRALLDIDSLSRNGRRKSPSNSPCATLQSMLISLLFADTAESIELRRARVARRIILRAMRRKRALPVCSIVSTYWARQDTRLGESQRGHEFRPAKCGRSLAIKARAPAPAQAHTIMPH